MSINFVTRRSREDQLFRRDNVSEARDGVRKIGQLLSKLLNGAHDDRNEFGVGKAESMVGVIAYIYDLREDRLHVLCNEAELRALLRRRCPGE